MNSIVVFIGSPRKKGFSTELVMEAIRGAESKGVHVKLYDLNDSEVRGCQGCFYCRTHEACATKDYLNPMLDDIKNADGVILGSPIYFGQPSGQTMQWLNRMYPAVGTDGGPRYPGKKIITIFSQASGNQSLTQSNIDTFNNYFTKAFGWTIEDSILCTGTGVPEFKPSEALLKRAFNDGVALIK